jgi:predicted lipase
MKTKLQLLIQACINSYNGKHGVVRKVFDSEENFEVNSSQGFIGKLGEKTYLIFRGSDEFEDWKQNFQFKKVMAPFFHNDNNSLVHEGFLHSYLNIRDIILNKFKNFDGLIIAGHSLGGALATLCAVDPLINLTNVSCTIFGAPRVGNPHFVKLYDQKIPSTLRVVYGGDPVPQVPMRSLGFMHVGKEFHIGPKSKLPNPIDHMPQKYLEALSKL